MNLKETYNRIAEDWYQDHKQDDWWIEGTDTFISFLQKGDLVLDIGCGGGDKSKYLTEKKLQVVGVDLSEKMIEIAKREVPSSAFFVLDLNEVTKLEYMFDGIFMQAVLLHIPKKEIIESLKRVTKKLKEGGYLYIAVKEKRLQGVEEEIKVENDYGYPYERFFSYFTLDELESYLQHIGLKVVFSKIKPVGNTNWVEIIGRK